MPVILDLVCRSCGTDHPRTAMRGKIEDARCGTCGERALRASWKRGIAPGVSVFRAVQITDGTEITSPEELGVRAAQVMQGMDPSARVVFDDDKAAAQQRIDEIRHRTWADQQARGIDEATIAEADAMGRAAQAQIAREARHADDPDAVARRHRSPSAWDIAKLTRHGTTDPTPSMSIQVGAEAEGDYGIPRPVAEHE